MLDCYHANLSIIHLREKTTHLGAYTSGLKVDKYARHSDSTFFHCIRPESETPPPQFIGYAIGYLLQGILISQVCECGLDSLFLYLITSAGIYHLSFPKDSKWLKLIGMLFFPNAFLPIKLA